jgi:DNA-directed RNA polymerase specialized sigma24 family protein
MVQQPEFPQNHDFNQSLKTLTIDKLAIEAQNHPANSSKRKKILTILVDKVMRSGELGHPQSGRWSASIFNNLRNEAISETCLEIHRRIEAYDPTRACVMAWINCLLRYQFMAAVTQYFHTSPGRDPQERYSPVLSLDLLEWDVPAEETSSDSPSLEQFLEEDPENLLQVHIQGHPEITWQWIAREKYVADQTWRKISEMTGISVQTLCSFFNRQLRPLKPYFHKYFR